MKPSELIADENNWCQRHMALNVLGQSVDRKSKDACRWCLIGAIGYCFDDPKIYSEIVAKVNGYMRIKHVGFFQLSVFNDDCNRKHAEVIALLKEVGL